MTIALGIWHLELKGGESKVFETPASIHITNVSYGEEIADPKSRTVVKLTFESLVDREEDESEDSASEDGVLIKHAGTTALCALTPGKIEQASINVILDVEEVFKIDATGANTVYLTGNYIQQSLDQGEGSDFDDEDGEDAYDLRDVSSDVEMHLDDLDGLVDDSDRLQEVDEEDEAPKSSKRARESDATGEEKPSKAEKKKKLKAEGGKAIPVESPAKKEDKEDKKEKKEEKKEKKEKKTLPSGVVVQDAKVGAGPMAKKGTTVKMRYIGKLLNGKEFDKNTKGKPFTFNLGKGEVIKGWDEGIVGMQVGGERILTIPANMAYGKRAQEGIPANSTLVFEVKLLDIK